MRNLALACNDMEFVLAITVLTVRKITCAVGVTIMLFLGILLTRHANPVCANVAIAQVVLFVRSIEMVAISTVTIDLFLNHGVPRARKVGGVRNADAMRKLLCVYR